MINTKYKLSQKLLENISSIERLYGQLESQVVPKELLLNLEKHNLVKSLSLQTVLKETHFLKKKLPT